MKILKLLLSVVLVITLLGAGVYYLSNRGLLPTTQAQAAKDIFEHPVLKTITTQISNTLAQLELTDKVPEITSSVTSIPQLASIASQSGVVLGTSEVIEADVPPLPQRAFEYGRYLYCQEVIKDYEQRFPQPPN